MKKGWAGTFAALGSNGVDRLRQYIRQRTYQVENSDSWK